jgi:DNA polymerase III alpha subunit
MVALDAIRAQAYLKSPAAMWRLFGTQLPSALEATVEVARRCQFRLPLADRTPAEQRYGPGRFFGLAPAHESVQRELTDVVAVALPRRCAETGRDAHRLSGTDGSASTRAPGMTSRCCNNSV